jgi:DNA-binding CsgD family transcriptional regulator
MVNPAATLTDRDTRMLVRLVADTALLAGTHVERKRHLLAGLSGILDVDAWGWALSCQMVPGGPQVYVNYVKGGFSDNRFTRMMAAHSHPKMNQIGRRIFEEVARTKRTVTMARHQIDPDGRSFVGEVGRLWQEADIGSIILSFTPLDEKSASGVAVFRRVGQPTFTDREIQIAQIVLTEVPWLHSLGWPDDRGVTVPQLTARQRIVLNLLLDGLPRKRIAAQMHVSPLTLDGYVKAIFRHFGVRSQAALLRRFSGHIELNP